MLQLVELAHLILGIRVFNFDIGKGGAGITDIAKLATDVVSELERKLQVKDDTSPSLFLLFRGSVTQFGSPLRALSLLDFPTVVGAGTSEPRHRDV